MRGSMPMGPKMDMPAPAPGGYGAMGDNSEEAPLANVLAETAHRLQECCILAGNIHLALFGPEPGCDGKATPSAEGVVWTARENLVSATELMKELNNILRAIEKK